MAKLLWNVGRKNKDGPISKEDAETEGSFTSIPQTTLLITLPIYHIFLTHLNITLSIATAGISVCYLMKFQLDNSRDFFILST
jgi:hypothetical protein